MNLTSVAAIEAFLISTWAEVLQVDDVPPDGNFIGLGGDSITAALCLNRVRASFDVELSIEALLDIDATLQDHAATIHRLLTRDAAT